MVDRQVAGTASESAGRSVASDVAGHQVAGTASEFAVRVRSDVSGVAARSTRLDQQDRLLLLAGRLTDRDRHLCQLLYEHRVLTTGQVADVGFTGLRKAQRRLVVLHHLDVVDRFRPRGWPGSDPYHFTLGPAGAAVIAADRGISLADLGWRRDTAAALAISQRLTHTVGVNGFFTALLAAARPRPHAQLAAWWSERRCAAAWGTLVRPDGYAIWVDDDGRVPFFLEYDTGSERLARLAGKLGGYARLAAAAGHPTWVCFTFPTPAREAAARRVLGHPTVRVATAALRPGISPDGSVWLAVGDPGPRRRLADLGHPDRILPRR